MSRNLFIAACWSALFAILMATLGPGLLQRATDPSALAYAQGSICLSPGAVFAPLADAHDPPAGLHAAFDHCPFCKVGADGAVLPTPAFTFHPLTLAARGSAPPLLAHFRAHTWLAANPRGPPLS